MSVYPPQCLAGLVKMPKWLPAITLDLPMALPLSTGEWCLYTQLLGTACCITCPSSNVSGVVCCAGIFRLPPLFRLGEGAVVPVLQHLGCKPEFRQKNGIALINARACVGSTDLPDSPRDFYITERGCVECCSVTVGLKSG